MSSPAADLRAFGQSLEWDMIFVAAASLWKAPVLEAIALTEGRCEALERVPALSRVERAAWVAHTLRAALRGEPILLPPHPGDTSITPVDPRAPTDLPLPANFQAQPPSPAQLAAPMMPGVESVTNVDAQVLDLSPTDGPVTPVDEGDDTDHSSLEVERARLAAISLGLAARERALEVATVRASEARIVALATSLAEALIGSELTLRPEAISELLGRVLAAEKEGRPEAIVAHPEDAATLMAMVGDLIPIRVNAALSRGSLTVYTERGSLDARLDVQLRALLAALHG